MKKQTRQSLLEKQRALRAKAMPEVRKLVRRYGRTTIQRCLIDLRDYEKKLEELSETRKKVRELEKQVGK